MLYLISANPFSRKFSEKKIKLIQNYLKKRNLKFITIISESKDNFRESLLNILKDHYRENIKLISVGGDGTLNLIINIIAKNNIQNTSIGLIPLGTANIVAKELNYPNKVEKCLNIIINSSEREITLSKINEYYFIFTCGIGYDGLVTKEINEKFKKYLGSLEYVLKGLKILKEKSLPEFKFSIDEISTASGRSLIVNRIQRYAINKKIFKSAYILSDYFIIAIFKQINFSSLSKFFLGLNSPYISFKKAKKIEFFENKIIPIQIDGEYINIAPKTIKLSDKKIKFILP